MKCAPPEHGGIIMRYSENEENFTFGFWPGNKNYPYPAFYSYTYPPPPKVELIEVNPGAAHFDAKQGLFVLKYDDVRNSSNPASVVMEFLHQEHQSRWMGH